MAIKLQQAADFAPSGSNKAMANGSTRLPLRQRTPACAERDTHQLSASPRQRIWGVMLASKHWPDGSYPGIPSPPHP